MSEVGADTAPAAIASSPALAGRLGGQALYVLAGNLFTLVVGLPLQIYVSRKLGPGGLGTFSLLEGAAATTAGLLGLGLAPTAVRFIPQYLAESRYGAISRLIARGTLALMGLGLLGYVAFASAAFLGHFVPSADTAAVWLMAGIIPLGLLSYFIQQSLRGFQEIRYLVFGSSFLQVAIKASATVILFALGAGLAGYAAATVLASTATVLWLGIGLVRRAAKLPRTEGSTLSPAPWKRFAAINYATSLASLPGSYLDRFLLGYFFGVSPVGVLAAIRQLQQLPAVVYQMLLSVASPMFASAYARDARAEQQHLYALTTDWAVRTAIPLILFLSLFARPVLAMFGPNFANSGMIPLQILMLAQFFNLVTGPNGGLGMMSGLERELFRIDLATVTGTALLLAVSVPFFGLVAVAVCILGNSIANNLASLILVRAKLQIRWWNARYLRWLVPMLCTVGVALVFLFLVHGWTAVRLAVALLAMYGTFAIASLLQGLHEDDLELIRHVRQRLAFS